MVNDYQFVIYFPAEFTSFGLRLMETVIAFVGKKCVAFGEK